MRPPAPDTARTAPRPNLTATGLAVTIAVCALPLALLYPPTRYAMAFAAPVALVVGLHRLTG
jgi:hypothetical protein